MQFWWAKAGLLIALVLGVVSFPAVVDAISYGEEVELTIPQTTLTVSGKAAPGALVSIKESGAVIGSVTADASGDFTSTVVRTPGLHTIDVSYRDTTNVPSSVISRNISVTAQQDTKSVFFLSPTLSRVTSSQVLIDSILQFRGYSYPGAAIELSVDGGAKRFYTTALPNGYYEFIFDANKVGVGQHDFQTKAKIGNEHSALSRTSRLSVVKTQTISPTTPDIVVRPNQLPPPITETPEDGTILDGNSVTISGQSVPNAQINIYANESLYGTIVADSSGLWSFEFIATSSPVRFVFEACVGEKCSVLSRTLTLFFNGIPKNECGPYVRLDRYRFWGVQTGGMIELNVLQSRGDGVLTIDWGDDITEQFDHDSQRPQPIRKSYRFAGNYSGKAIFQYDECQEVRYFSVAVDNVKTYDDDYWPVIILILVLAPASYYVNSRKVRN